MHFLRVLSRLKHFETKTPTDSGSPGPHTSQSKFLLEYIRFGRWLFFNVFYMFLPHAFNCVSPAQAFVVFHAHVASKGP